MTLMDSQLQPEREVNEPAQTTHELQPERDVPEREIQRLNPRHVLSLFTDYRRGFSSLR